MIGAPAPPPAADARSAGPAVVALGGGHGLAASLGALRQVTERLTAVVTVADDGGSSGRLRRELPDQLAPGDLRKALIALAGEPDGVWARLFAHRFGGAGELADHAVGNLVLAGLADVVREPVAALDEAARLLGARGRVLPMTTCPVDIVARVAGLAAEPCGALTEVRGQVAVALTTGAVAGVRLEPEHPPACPDAVAAVQKADFVVFGPGSWFTSVLPHLLVPDLREALVSTPARRIVVLNLAPQPGETHGFSPETHLEVLSTYAPGMDLDVVVADERATPDPDALRSVARSLGGHVVLAPVGASDGSPRHDTDRLAAVYARIFVVPDSDRDGVDGTADTNSADREGRTRWR